MLTVEDVLCELKRATSGRNGGVNQGLPPGFRFHPTDEELVTFYLAAKIFNCNLFGVEIAEINLNHCEPWELPEVARMGEKEWYFFSLRDRKYTTGLRTNRATCAGYWKATGKDRLVHSASTGILLGMKKTLVFYHGRAPRGEKTKWVMHEYRLNCRFSCRHSCKDEWVICRIIHKTTEKAALLLDQGQQSRHHGASSLSDGELLLCDTPSFSIDSQVLQNPLLQVQVQAQEINPVVYPSNEVLLKFNPLMNFEYQPEPSLQSTLFKSQVEYKEHEAVAAAIPRQCKTESNALPHLQDPLVIDSDHFYHYNLCDETLPPLFVLDKIVEKGSWPVDV